MLTVGNLVIGFFAILLILDDVENNLAFASFLIILAMLTDGLDGRVARRLGVTSEFGKELDSLCDVVSFGIAPAAIIYMASLHEYGVMGMAVSCLFPVAGALRLARFNVHAGTPGYFTGLPITAAGGALATFALYTQAFTPFVIMLITLFLAFLMVSQIKYPNFKKVGWPRHTLQIIAVTVVLVGILAWFFPKEFTKIVFIPLAVYAVYGISKNILIAIRRARHKSDDDEETSYRY